MRKLLTVVLIGVAVWILFAVLGSRRHLNLLLISVDTLRPDHLGCYGYEDVRTPAIDRLAAEGVRFADVTSAIPLTLPSHATILTGLYPPSHGIRDNGFMALPADIQTLAETLKQAGYSTCAVVAAYVLDSKYGLDQGFDIYDDDLAGGRKPREFGYTEIQADAVTDKAAAYIGGMREPFFAFVHYYDPHATYDPPEPYATAYADRPYDGEIAYTDHAIGRLIDALEATGVFGRTLVVFLSDHGESMGEHHEPTHGVLVYNSTLHVPLIVRVPQGSALRKSLHAGTIAARPVSLADIHDSVLDMLGISADHETDGESFMGEAGIAPVRAGPCYFESLYPRIAYLWSPLRGIREGEWKYILAPEEELYLVSEDPGELSNLGGREPERARDLRNSLVALARSLERNRPASPSRPTPEEVRKLRALGYLSGGNREVPEVLDTAGADPKTIIVGFAGPMGAGEDAYATGDFAKALESFSEALGVDPQNPQALIYKARALAALGRTGEAEADYRRVIEIDPTNSTPYFTLGTMAQSQGRTEEALGYYEKALELVPGSSEALANIGSILMEKGLTDSAEKVLRQALEAEPRSEIATVNLGLLEYSRGATQEALELFRRTLVLNPENVKAMANIAAIYATEGQVDSTITYWEMAATVEPASATILSNLGNAYRQKGLPARAEECYEQALKIDPDNVLSLFGMAAVAAGRGETGKAETLLKRILVLRPDFAPARNALESLKSKTPQ
jgi:arylsulfatase A-like enzyme/Flp pilus assembly protein TadD